MEETWRPVPGYEGLYEVSDLGQVHSLHRKPARGCFSGILKGTVVGGYLRVCLWTPGEVVIRRSEFIHKLVAIAFLGHRDPMRRCCRPDGKNINHKNGNKLDNRLENLEYVTGAENLRHARQVLGKEWTPHATKHWNHRLTTEQVIAVRSMSGTQASIAEMFGVSSSVICKIKSGKARRYG